MVWDKDVPASGTSLRNSNPQMLENNSIIETAIDLEHAFTTGSAQTGVHAQGSARCFFQDAAPATQVGGGAFVAADLGSLWIDSNSSPDNQFNILTATAPTWTPVSTEVIAVLLAANRVFAGTLGVTGDLAVNTDKFTVAAASGNALVAGTLDVVGNIDPTSYETTRGGFLDEDAMGSDAADKVASQQSIKTRIASQTGGDVPTLNDSESNAMLKAHAYLAQTSGFVNAFNTGTGNNKLFVHTTNDPAGAGTKVDEWEGDAAADKGGMFTFVANGKYFEVTSGGTPTILWTPLVTGGAAPIDQD